MNQQTDEIQWLTEKREEIYRQLIKERFGKAIEEAKKIRNKTI